MTSTAISRQHYSARRSELIRSGMLAEALDLNLEWSQKNPDDATVHYELAWIQAANKRSEDSLASIDNALILDGHNPKYHQLKFNLLTALGKTDEACSAKTTLEKLQVSAEKHFRHCTSMVKDELSKDTVALLSQLSVEFDDALVHDAIRDFLDPLWIDSVPDWATYIQPRYQSGEIANVPGIGRFHLSNPDDVIQKRICRGMCWEPQLLSIVHGLSNIADKQMAIIEIGANIGALTVPTASMVAGPIWAFEPNPAAADILKANIALNDLPCVEIKCVALGEAHGKAEIASENSNNLGATRYTTQVSAPTSTTSMVDVHPLDHYVEQWHEASMGFNTLVKIDVEGMESEVLKGARRFLTDIQPIVLIEIWGQNVSAIRSLAREFNYELQPISGDDFVMYPMT